MCHGVILILPQGSHGHSHGHSHGGDFDDEDSINAVMGFHYTPTDEFVQFPFGPKDSGEFPKRCAELCLKHMQVSCRLLF